MFEHLAPVTLEMLINSLSVEKCVRLCALVSVTLGKDNRTTSELMSFQAAQFARRSCSGPNFEESR